MFERTIDRVLAQLPPQFAERLDNVQILVEHEHDDEPDLYGLYEGIPLPERSAGDTDGQLPTRVFVFRRPLVEDFGADPRRLAEEIRVTLLHELAHHFGIDDSRLTELGWA